MLRDADCCWCCSVASLCVSSPGRCPCPRPPSTCLPRLLPTSASPTSCFCCRLFEAVTPLLADLVGRLSADIAPFCSVPAGMRFTAGGAGGADEAGGAWRNFFVGLVGNVAAHEDDILWPNQVGDGRSGCLGCSGQAGCQVAWLVGCLSLLCRDSRRPPILP